MKAKFSPVCSAGGDGHRRRRCGSSRRTYLPGMSVSLVGRRHGIGGNQIFTWRRLMAQGALTAAAAGEEVVPASEYRALEAQVRELHRLLGKKAMENELLREAVSRAAGPKKTAVALDLIARGRSVSAVADALGIARPHLSAMRNRPPPRPAWTTATTG